MTTPPSRPRLILPRALAVASLLLLIGPFWRRDWKRRVARVGMLAVYVYLGVLLALVALEDRLLYHPTTAADSWLPPPAGVPVEDVELTAADGAPVHAWWAAPPGWVPDEGAALFSHGSAGNVTHWGQGFAYWQGCFRTGVLIFDYPGYGKSGGRPGEAGCYAAGDAAHDWLTGVKRVPAENIILVGRSLGCAIATDLASRRPCRALILCSPFTSFPDLAQEKYPMFPGRWLVHNRFDNLGKIALCRCPVFIAHGTADTLIPFSQGERLFAAAPGPKRFHAMPGLDHNEGPDAAFYGAVRQFLDETAPRPGVSANPTS